MASPDLTPAHSTKKKVGGVKVVVMDAATSGHRYCVAGCQGRYVQGMWVHDNWCKEVRMIWTAHDQTHDDWMCFYGCPGQRMPSGWMHHWDCEFWVRHPELTGFDPTPKEIQGRLL